ncbi:right-handed parallel beta-helix repeat-containing protein [Zobellia uliginosa]|uniref:right-handed parallel beta-helix repeat-containing protein n=1 Tax=Zobellia uliginosa TaxID=143224 RepID=UPI001C06A3C5|nr:right-handed parallel beta-helix repeat-containing protein [Zobellia uliginosa]MBU2947821.1 right-handed parallel beta-helix repeat-containing protein [Zobellia uliginosa]
MNLKTHLSIIVFLLIGIQICKATDYYVATNGDDNSTGTTIGSPFLTLEKGIAMLHAGDTLYIMGGTYRLEGLDEFSANDGAVISRKGTESNPITIMAYPNEDVTIKGSQIIRDWTPLPGSNNVYRKAGWSYESQQVFVDGVPLIQTGAVANSIGGVAADGFWRIENPDLPNSPYNMNLSDLDDDGNDGRFFYDKNSETLYVRLRDDADPEGHLIEASTITRIIMAGASAYVHIKDINFRHSNSSTFKSGGGAMIELGDYCKVENCNIQYGDISGVDIGFEKTGSQLINCVIKNNGSVGVSATRTSNFLIKNCQINNNNYRHFNFLWHAGGIKAGGDSWGILENSEIANNYGSGVWFDHCDIGRKSIIRNNYIHDNGPKHAGIFIEVSRNIDIYNNIIDHNSRLGIEIAASDHINVFNNEIMNTTGGQDLDLGTQIEAVAGLRIIRDPSNFPTTLSNNYIFNNVFFDNSACWFDVDVFKNNPTNGIEINIFDNNLYYNANGEYKWRAEDISVNDLTAWRNFGHDINGLISDPKYIPGEKIIKSSLSPAIDAGRDDGAVIDLVTNDYYDTVRPQGITIDIGAFENLATLDVIPHEDVCNSPLPNTGIRPNQIFVGWDSYTDSPCNLMDNDFATQWSVEGTAEDIIFELNENQEFDQFQIAYSYGNTKEFFYAIQISDDGSFWTDIVSNGISERTDKLQNINLGSQNAKYLKYIGKGNSGSNNWNSITEVRIVNNNMPSQSAKGNYDPNEVNSNSDAVISVYPNPTRNVLHIKLLAGTEYNTYSLFSVNGALIKKGKIEPNQSDLSILVENVNTGIYIVHLSDNKGNTSYLKLMKEE